MVPLPGAWGGAPTVPLVPFLFYLIPCIRGCKMLFFHQTHTNFDMIGAYKRDHPPYAHLFGSLPHDERHPRSRKSLYDPARRVARHPRNRADIQHPSVRAAQSAALPHRQRTAHARLRRAHRRYLRPNGTRTQRRRRTRRSACGRQASRSAITNCPPSPAA